MLRRTAIENCSAFTSFILNLSTRHHVPSFITQHVNALPSKNPRAKLKRALSWWSNSRILGFSCGRSPCHKIEQKLHLQNVFLKPLKFVSNITTHSLGMKIICKFMKEQYMGPQNACSYADIAMGVIDEKAKSGDIEPRVWWQFWDDVFDLCMDPWAF